MMRLKMGFALLFCLFAMPLAAQDLDKSSAARFIESLPEVILLGEDLQESGLAEGFQNALKPSVEHGFSPYQRGTDWMKTAAPESYQKMKDVAADHGFSDVDEWARVGDQVMGAFMAMEMQNIPDESRAMAEQMTPDMLAQMPQAVREQIEGMKIMLAAIKDVPEQNIETVRPLVPDLKAVLGGQ
ncbi:MULTISPECIES: hypothetical protein [unclassified Iodidimonas]|jgi:lipoate synthase|uniref:hypothetical protein n=1 Tax=unclassified Iodidimonas TaxID=2626145 RepID=UPI002482D7B9|nr:MULTISPECIES: hypothetical protein [unclassified Iodidimonas]